MLNQAAQEIFSSQPKDLADFLDLKRKIFARYGLPQVSNAELLKLYNKLEKKPSLSPVLKEILIKRKIRTLSGVAPVAVLTKPYPCSGKCAYCPHEKAMPQSYLSNEPAVMRAALCHFQPAQQVQMRLRALEANGHKPEKIELIVMGGTWSFLPQKYQYWFIKECFRAANEYPRAFSEQKIGKTSLTALREQLAREQKKNEKAKYRIVGLTLETRPDCLTEKEIFRFREMGCTRVEMGVQAIDDEILRLNKRGHGVAEIKKATRLLRLAGLKIVYHLMPELPGSTPEKDYQMFQEIFSSPDYQPDQIKIYPCVVVKGSLLYKWWQQGKYQPYSNEEREKLLLAIKKIVPYHVRIVRLIRDIPTVSIEAGNKVSNLRQVLQKKLREQGTPCRCLRCREARQKPFSWEQSCFFQEVYPTNPSGEEYFLSQESPQRETLYAFLRLRLPRCFAEKETEKFYRLFPELKGAALIREVHTYGKLVPLKEKGKSAAQHQGLGKHLIARAEEIARQQGYKKIAVIAGIGVREYYRRLGYRRQGTYLIKKI